MSLLLEDVAQAWNLLLSIHVVQLLRLLPRQVIVWRCEPTLSLKLVPGTLVVAGLGLLLIFETIVERDVYLEL